MDHENHGKIFTRSEQDALKEKFLRYDTIGDGKIDISLLGEALRGLGLNPTERDVQKRVQELESIGSRRVTFEEFFPIYHWLSKKGPQLNESDFIKCFRGFDKEQNGTVSIGELRYVLTSLGEGLSTEEVELLTRGIESKDGRVDIKAFVRAVMGG